MEMLEEKGQILPAGKKEELFPSKQHWWRQVLENIEYISEVRIRVNHPVLVFFRGEEWLLTREGRFSKAEDNCKVITAAEIRDILEYWCGNSRYAYEDQIRRGFLTLKNGHRAGLCGEAILNDREEVIMLKYISFINLRIAHQVKNISRPILPYLYRKGRVKNLLIISEPGAGKTTLLRDLVYMISEGNHWGEGISVSLIDERREIAACYQGIPQLDIGRRTDVMDGCPKDIGMQMVLRTMSPRVIAIDELLGKQEQQLISRMVMRGAQIVATAHASSVDEWREKQENRELEKRGVFDLFVELYRERNCFRGRIYEKGQQKPCGQF